MESHDNWLEGSISVQPFNDGSVEKSSSIHGSAKTIREIMRLININNILIYSLPHI